MFDFWVALAEGLWKKKDSFVPSRGTPEEKSASTALLNHILDRLLVTAIPEYDAGIVYKPNVTYLEFSLPENQNRILKLLDLMVLTDRVHYSVQLIVLVTRPQGSLLANYKNFVIPFVPRLKFRFRKCHAPHIAVLDLFLRAIVGRYLQDLLGTPSQKPEASIDRVNCGCEDCAKANRFLRSDAATETFRVSQRRRSHVEGQLQAILQGGFTFTTISRGSLHTLEVTKRHGTMEAGKWYTRVQKAREFLATVGTPDELARIMGERYPDVQAALAGTKQYQMETPTLAIPPVEGAATETGPATQASTSVARVGTASVLG